MTSRTRSGGLNDVQDLLHIAPNTTVERDVLGIVEWIRNYGDYYAQIDVAYLDPDKCDSPFDAPYIIFEHCRDGIPRLVCSVWKLDETVKERIKAADTTLYDVGAQIEKHNEARRKELAQASKDRMAEAGDIYAHALANPKTSYTFPNTDGDNVTLDDHVGIVKRNGQSVEPGSSG